jgi:hypothetical protein
MNAFEPGLQSVADTRSQAKLARIAVKSTNPCVRRAAVAKLANQPLLYRIALEDVDVDVRQAAAFGLVDPSLLARYLSQTRDLRFCAWVVHKLTDQTQMTRFVLELDSSDNRKERSIDNYLSCEVVERITNQLLLAKLALEAKPRLGGGLALHNLTDQGLLAKIAKYVTYTQNVEMMRIGRQAAEKLTNEVLLAEMGMWVRPEWTRKVTDQAMLARLARESVNAKVRDAALEKLTRPDLLASLAISAPDDYIRHDAMDKLMQQAWLEQEDLPVILATADTDENIRRHAMAKLTQQKWLEQVAVEATDSAIREMAVGGLTNLELLAKIAVSDKREGIRKFAVRRAADLRTAASNALNRAGKPSRSSTNGIPADVALGLDLF